MALWLLLQGCCSYPSPSTCIVNLLPRDSSWERIALSADATDAKHHIWRQLCSCQEELALVTAICQHARKPHFRPRYQQHHFLRGPHQKTYSTDTAHLLILKEARSSSGEALQEILRPGLDRATAAVAQAARSRRSSCKALSEGLQQQLLERPDASQASGRSEDCWASLGFVAALTAALTTLETQLGRLSLCWQRSCLRTRFCNVPSSTPPAEAATLIKTRDGGSRGRVQQCPPDGARSSSWSDHCHCSLACRHSMQIQQGHNLPSLVSGIHHSRGTCLSSAASHLKHQAAALSQAILAEPRLMASCCNPRFVSHERVTVCFAATVWHTIPHAD